MATIKQITIRRKNRHKNRFNRIKETIGVSKKRKRYLKQCNRLWTKEELNKAAAKGKALAEYFKEITEIKDER